MFWLLYKWISNETMVARINCCCRDENYLKFYHKLIRQPRPHAGVGLCNLKVGKFVTSSQSNSNILVPFENWIIHNWTLSTHKENTTRNVQERKKQTNKKINKRKQKWIIHMVRHKSFSFFVVFLTPVVSLT